MRSFPTAVVGLFLPLFSATTRSASALSAKPKERVLVLGGTGFLGQAVCNRAVTEGYEVTSLSRRGLPPTSSTAPYSSQPPIDYRQGDATKPETIRNILQEENANYSAIIHCVGLLFDDNSGLGQLNRFASGSGSVPSSGSSYDQITRLTAFHAIEAAQDYAQRKSLREFPFVFTSAAEAGWPEVELGDSVEEYLAPDFLKRYLAAKRAVEAKLMEDNSSNLLRPVIFRPSLIYTLEKPQSLLSVGAFFIGNQIGLPFVDRPVTIQTLSAAMVASIKDEAVRGKLRYPIIEELGQR